jgi:uncharacterized protein YhbP (UPF0306 family)
MPNESKGICAILDAHVVAHLATAGDGGPHSAPVFFARVGDSLGVVWNSALAVLHSCHLAQGADMALSVAPSSPSMLHIEGVQMRGRGERASNQEEAAAVYCARFPAARAMLAVMPGHAFYRFEPVWVRHVRLVAGIPQTQEWKLPLGDA